MIQIYGIKNCDSVKKAVKFFKTHDLDYELFDFKEQKVSPAMVSAWLEKTDMKTLFNSRSTTYRTLKLKELDPNDEEKREWLVKEPLLIKRPVVEYNGNLLVGFNEDQYNGAFL